MTAVCKDDLNTNFNVLSHDSDADDANTYIVCDETWGFVRAVSKPCLNTSVSWVVIFFC
jgi:hypothetical protein